MTGAGTSHVAHAERTIRSRSLGGEYPPGSRLRERELSDAWACPGFRSAKRSPG
ncbi:hypothetical protein OHA04_06170 [Streptomyces sp. NBC_01590]